VTIRTVAAIWVIAALTLAAAAIAWVWFGPSAAVVVVGFVSACTGLSKALIELNGKLNVNVIRPERKTRGSAEGRNGKSLWVTVPVSLLIGIAVGYLALPPAIRWGLRPVVSISVPEQVRLHQPINIRWRNVPRGDQVWLLVTARAQDGEVRFVQACHTQGERAGAMTCDIEVGGADGAGREFEVQGVLANVAASAMLDESRRDAGYLRNYPVGVVVLESVRVRREM
jgi:hypothetical protein